MAQPSRAANDPLINPRIKVGTFCVPITVSHLAAGASITIEALLDSGSSIPVVATSLLRQIGVEPVGGQRFEMADGSPIDYAVGNVFVTVEGRTAPTLCAFGEDDADSILGAVVLEMVGLTIDPRNRRACARANPSPMTGEA